MPRQLALRFGTPTRSLIRASVAPLLWGLVPGAVTIWFARRFSPDTWPQLILDLAGSSLMLLLVWWFGELKTEERGHYAARLRMALPGGRA